MRIMVEGVVTQETIFMIEVEAENEMEAVDTVEAMDKKDSYGS